MLKNLVNHIMLILKDNCVGIYLHGSAAMSCFQPQKSDIDFIIVIKHLMTIEEKISLLDGLLLEQKSIPSKGLEMSVVLEENCCNISYPTPYEFHFSKAHEKEAIADKMTYCKTMHGFDPDLAAHFMMIKRRGIVLFGKPIDEVFTEGSKRDFLNSLLLDLKDYQIHYEANPHYFILNACRVLAYLENDLILSKKEGGEYYLDGNGPYNWAVLEAYRAYTNGTICKVLKQDIEPFLSEVIALMMKEL